MFFHGNILWKKYLFQEDYFSTVARKMEVFLFAIFYADHSFSLIIRIIAGKKSTRLLNYTIAFLHFLTSIRANLNIAAQRKKKKEKIGYSIL